ncbi:hypothetical protein ACWGIV_19275 [Streptomyces sp. NPDC054844]
MSHPGTGAGGTGACAEGSGGQNSPLPIYGARFRALDEFERALRLAGRLGGQLVRGMYDGLTDGTVAPG